MPVYLFTIHGYGTWMPDRPRGYTKRKVGVLPRDEDTASRYRDAMKHSAVSFDREKQRNLIDAILEKCKFRDWSCHGIATDPSHIHLVVSWSDNLKWVDVRRDMKSEMRRKLNASCGKRQWFSDGGSRRHVIDQEHLDHLIGEYLPGHRGLQWYPDRGVVRGPLRS